MKLPAFLTAALAVAGLILPFGAAQAAGNPVRITQCFIIEPKPFSKMSGGTQIDYINESPKVARSITFAVGYRNAEHNFLRRVTDEGTFVPGSEIKHHFSLYNDVVYGGKKVQSCSAVSAIYFDGTRWH